MNDFIFHIIKFKLRLFSKLFTKKNGEGKVVILSFKFIGDTVFTIPTIKIIKQKMPEKKIIIFCFEDSMPVYRIAFNNLEYITFKKDELNFESRFPNKNLINKLRKQSPTFLFDLTCEYQTAVAVFFSGSKNTIGFNTKYYEGIYKVFTEKRTQPDLIDMHFDPVKKFFNLNENDIDKRFIKNYKPDGKIIIHPFAGWKAKEWGLDNFIKLANDLNEAYEIEIVVKKKYFVG